MPGFQFYWAHLQSVPFHCNHYPCASEEVVAFTDLLQDGKAQEVFQPSSSCEEFEDQQIV